MSGSELFADIALKVERERIGVMPEALVYMPENLSVDRVKIHRNAVDRVAPAVKIAENVSARERYRSKFHIY